MSIIDDLLGQSRLLPDPQVPADVIPYDDIAYPAFTVDGRLLWDGDGGDVADDVAAQSLAALCEAVLAHCTPGQLADFLTDQLPQPRAAWLLGCALQLAGADDGARFWWQYAAGAGDEAPSYCLYLLHLARGDIHAAALWQAQAGPHAPDAYLDLDQDAPAYRMMTADASMSTVLRILSRLTRTRPRRPTPTASAVIDFVATAVAIGYDIHPDLEIPVPGPHFAEHLEIIIAATSPAPARTQTACIPAPRRALPGTPATPARGPELPNRPTHKDGVPHPSAATGESERLLVEVTAAGHEPESASTFFKEAVAVCGRTATAARTPADPDTQATLSYYLDRYRPRPQRTRTSPFSPVPSGFGTRPPAGAGTPRPSGYSGS
ncbi:hypothetical protein [Streptomyces shenzhenensis]|uniref:hypothetical protein n=1 Tax=Streptomyces shenzhenensis TaxID=943815 RepID=UPI0015F038F6|nr:hypothetical protein [Streptomyces shenzhenensis]